MPHHIQTLWRGHAASQRQRRAQTSIARQVLQSEFSRHALLLVQVQHRWRHSRRERSIQRVHAGTDYRATQADSQVLRLPPRMDLRPDQIRSVFGFPRDLQDKYWIGKLIGAGSFGVVKEALHKESNELVAIKTISKIPKNGASTPRHLLKLQHEVDAMQQLSGSLDSISLRGVYEDDKCLHVVMELCEGGNLLDRLKQKNYSERYIARIIKSIMRFISQCHAKGIVFRDVKPENFLFVSKDDDSTLRATDFGLSIRHSPDEAPLTSRSGTPAYMAPEVIKQSYDQRADVWSIGIMAYQLLTGTFPWGPLRSVQSMETPPTNDKEKAARQRRRIVKLWQKILHANFNYTNAALSPDAKDFLQRCLERDPSLRISAAEALHHPWIKGSKHLSDLPLEGTVLQRLQRFATYARLKQVVLRLMAEEVSKQGSVVTTMDGCMLDSIKEVFNGLDSDNNGSISVDELIFGLQQQGYRITEGEVKQLMDKVDLDGDGSATFSELAAGLIDWTAVQQDEDEWGQWIDRVFTRLDLDGDGFICFDEVLNQLGEGGHPELILEARRALREVDVDGDGRISRPEFHTLLVDNASMPDMLTQYDMRLPDDTDFGLPTVTAAA